MARLTPRDAHTPACYCSDFCSREEHQAVVRLTSRVELKSDALLERFANDPDAGAWAEWVRRLMEGDTQRKRKAVERVNESEPAATQTRART